MKVFTVFLMLCTCSLSVFSSTPPDKFIKACEDNVNKLLWVTDANPELDAINSLNQGNKKFLAIYGYTYIILGVSEIEAKKIIESSNFTPIEGTSDFICSPIHSELIKKAKNYASIYIETIMQGL